MPITAKFTKVSCFVNTVLQLCLILDKIFTLCRLRPFTDSLVLHNNQQTFAWSIMQCANHMQGVRVLMTFQPCLILMQSSNVAGQGHLTSFSTGN